MSRPLMQHAIGQLEEMFSNSPTDVVILKQLTHELEHRKTPRAAALLARVQKSLSSGNKSEAPAPFSSPKKPKAPETQNLASLWEAPSPFNSVAGKDASVTVPTTGSDAALNKPSARKSDSKPVPEIPLADAYKILKSAPDTPWATIEQNRRRMVSVSNPIKAASLSPEKRDAALANAQSINAAFLSIWKARSNKN